jgi:hypothetical protein
MNGFLWSYIALPLIHWAIVMVALIVIGKLAEKLAAVLVRLSAVLKKLGDASKLAKKSGEMALTLPIRTEMAEISIQVTRADGTVEPPMTYRTYRNIFMRWAWAIKQAFAK